MKNARRILITAMIFMTPACSFDSLKRTGFEAVQNIGEQQCEKDLSSDCPQRESYESYQAKLSDLQ